MSDPNLPAEGFVQQTPPAPQAPYHQAPPVAPQQGYPVGMPPQPAPAKGLAISAMVVGIVSLLLFAVPVLGLLGGVVAVVLGVIALRKAQPKGLSLTGIITGSLAFLAAIGLLVGSLALLGGASTALDDLEKQVQELEETAPIAPEAQEPAAEPEPEPVAEPTWTTVTTISGSADQQTDTIVLTGGKVRLTYDFVDSSGYGTIVGAVYVLTEGTDIMVDGGIPDVMVSEAGAGETILRKSAGEYYLKVTSANASYTVTIEEEK